MSDYNLGALSPEEKDQLLMHLLQKGGGGDVAPVAEGSPEDDDTPILKVMEILCNLVDTIDQRLGKLEEVVMDDIIGGVETLYKGNLKAKGVDDLKGKYGSLFEPHMGALKEMAPDEDVFDKLYDLIDQAKGGEGWDDTKESGMAQDMAKAVADKIAKIKGEAPAAEAPAEAPAEGVAVEKTKVSAFPEGADENLMKRISSMKARNAANGK